jgi:hypothetical protein
MNTGMWAVALLAGVAMTACEAKRDTDNDETGTRTSADTVVTEREMRDTMIVRTDTTITKDTVRKQGRRPVDTDTVDD